MCCYIYYCADTGVSIDPNSGATRSIVTATGGYTPAQIAAGLPGQQAGGPGGASGFPAGVTGPGLSVDQGQVQSSLGDKILGGLSETGSAISCAVGKVTGAIPTLLIVLFVALLILVFVYGFAQSR